MEQIAAEQAAFTLMKESHNGSDISRRYNSLTIDEQKQVFTEMKNLKFSGDTMSLFGNVELFDSNHDGRMDDATAVTKDGVRHDVYNPPTTSGPFNFGDNGIAPPIKSSTESAHRADSVMPTGNGDRTVAGRKSQEDIVSEQVERTGADVLRRGTDIAVQELFRSVGSGGRGPSVGERIGERVSHEGISGAERVLHDVLRR